MTYSKLSLLRYFVLTNCFFYAYSSNPVSNVKNMQEPNRKVSIDIYVSLDDSKIPKTGLVIDFLTSIGVYKVNSKYEDFGGTLIKCTTEDQKINLSFEYKDGFWFINLNADEIIKSIEDGIKRIITNYSKNNGNYSYSKIKLYNSLLELLKYNFNEKCGNCLICYLGKSSVYRFFESTVSQFLYEKNKSFQFEYKYLNEGNDKLENIHSVEIFLKYKGELKDFYKYFLDNCFNGFYVLCKGLEKTIKNYYVTVTNKKEETQYMNIELQNLKYVNDELKELLKDIDVCKEKITEEFLKKNDNIDFKGLCKYIDELNSTLYKKSFCQYKMPLKKLKEKI